MNPILLPWTPPAPDAMPKSFPDFLRQLAGPRYFFLQGKDPSRTRAVVTLLHGNEPSGTLSLLRLLQERPQPAVNVLCCVINVEAALRVPPVRVLPGERDQNRCFGARVEDRPGQVARELYTLLSAQPLEVIVDLHNTSGAGPAYGVCLEATPLVQGLTALFGEHLMHTGLRLGTLIEGLSGVSPALTIECGGMHEARAHEVAYHGLRRFITAPDLHALPGKVLVHHHPVRLEVATGGQVAYADAKAMGADITLRSDADRLNFCVIEAGQHVGWLGPRGLLPLRVRGEDDRDRTEEFFVQEGDSLRARVPFRPMMVTTSPQVAESDCLFYAVRLDEERCSGALIAGR